MRQAPIAISLAAVLVLAGCSSTSEVSPVLPGNASEAVNVSDTAKPRVNMPTPIKASSVQCSQIIPGVGPYAKPGEMLNVEIAIFNGETGKIVEQTAWDGSNAQNLVIGDALFPGLAQGLECAREGSRIVVVVPPEEAFGQAGNPSLGIGPKDSLVFVMDVNRVYPSKANGVPQLSKDGLPMVVLAPNGQPGISVPEGPAPEQLTVSVLKRGSGDEIAAGDTVTMQYTGVLWADGSIFDSSWLRSAPVQVTVADAEAENAIIPGLSEALIGQTVGSQVLAVIPPELAYGDRGSSSIPPGSTLVFVVDILGVD